MMMLRNLPLMNHIPPEVREALASLWQAVQPVYEVAMRALKRLVAQGRGTTLGNEFKHVAVVGLGRSELSFEDKAQSIFGDHWYDITDDLTRRNMALLFFAPRDFQGEPMNPYMLLAAEGETLPSDPDAAEMAMQQAQEFVGALPLLDLCRMPPAEPNTVYLLVAADVLFHWDVKDNYVLPTSGTSWIRDVEHVLKSYPRTTQAVLFTQWDTDLLPQNDRLQVRSLRTLPLAPQVWINKPTVQQAYGNQVLTLGIAVAVLMGSWLWWRQSEIDALNDELRTIEQQIPASARFGDFQRAVSEQEKMMQKREIFFFAVKDMARALTLAEFKTQNFEVRNPQVQEPAQQYVVSVEAPKDYYKGWMEQEPMAKKVLLHSALIRAVRKPAGTAFRLEGLVDVDMVWPDYKALIQAKRATDKAKAKGGSHD